MCLDGKLDQINFYFSWFLNFGIDYRDLLGNHLSVVHRCCYLNVPFCILPARSKELMRNCISDCLHIISCINRRLQIMFQAAVTFYRCSIKTTLFNSISTKKKSMVKSSQFTFLEISLICRRYARHTFFSSHADIKF